MPKESAFQVLWNDLDREMSKKASQSSRARLDALELTWQGRVTMKDFKFFDAKFRQMLAEQKYLSQKEASDMYIRKLPSFLVERVQKEIGKFENKECLLLRGLPSLTLHEAKLFVQSVVGQMPMCCKKLDDGFFICLHTIDEARQLLARDRMALSSGGMLLVERASFWLSLDEVADLVKQALEPREMADEIKKNYAPQKFKPKARIQEVEMEQGDEEHELGGGAEVNVVGKGTRGKKPPLDKKSKTQAPVPALVPPPGEGSGPSPGAGQATPAVVQTSPSPPPFVASGTPWNGKSGFGYNYGKGKGTGKGNDGKGGKGGKGAWNGGRGSGKGY